MGQALCSAFLVEIDDFEALEERCRIEVLVEQGVESPRSFAGCLGLPGVICITEHSPSLI